MSIETVYKRKENGYIGTVDYYTELEKMIAHVGKDFRTPYLNDEIASVSFWHPKVIWRDLTSNDSALEAAYDIAKKKLNRKLEKEIKKQEKVERLKSR